MSNPSCGAEADSTALWCDEPPGHDNGGWHYDKTDDVTWREGRHLPEAVAPGARACVGPDVIDAAGNTVSVLAAPDGTVVILHAETGVTELDPAARDELRELLDRAAMPGVT